MLGFAPAQAPMCSVSTPDRTVVASDFNRAWVQKRGALAAAMDTLKNVRGELDSLYRGDIGDPGSGRELITAVALVAKTTTDLIQDIMPFGSEIKSVVYGTISNEKDIADIIYAYHNHGSLYWIDTGLTLGADVSPIIRALNSMKDLAKNMNEMMEFPDKVSESRNIYNERSFALSRQLDEMQKKLDQLEHDNHETAVDKLLNRYAETGRACEKLIKKTEEKHDNCLATKKSYITLMCGGMKGDGLSNCLSIANDTWKC
jgi:hypothetical protein